MTSSRSFSAFLDCRGVGVKETPYRDPLPVHPRRVRPPQQSDDSLGFLFRRRGNTGTPRSRPNLPSRSSPFHVLESPLFTKSVPEGDFSGDWSSQDLYHPPPDSRSHVERRLLTWFKRHRSRRTGTPDGPFRNVNGYQRRLSSGYPKTGPRPDRSLIVNYFRVMNGQTP